MNYIRYNIPVIVLTAIHTTSAGTRIEGNLMALNIWSGSYLDRYESMNFHFDPAVEAIDSTDLVLRDNVVAGCERMGYCAVLMNILFSSGPVSHHKVVGNFRNEADVRSLYHSRFRFNETSDVGACTHGRPAK